MEKKKISLKKTFKNLQVIISAFYAYSVMMGIVFSSAKYQAVGINIFEYAEVFDFLFYPLIQPKAILFSFIFFVFPATIMIIAWIFEKRKREKNPEMLLTYFEEKSGLSKKKWWFDFRMKAMPIYMILVFLPVYIFLSHTAYKQYTISNYKTLYDCVVLEYHDGDVLKGKMFGKVRDIVFIIKNCPCEIKNKKIWTKRYKDGSKDDYEVIAIPYGESIKSIRWAADCKENMPANTSK
ncbi:hypothetical protein N8345_03080 [Flavobacteriaceae bacterium]|nr:hypothetical protein [Flavobacteriaceae bacterium]MDC1460833.1 hypothetical protein [Flavobacteriaceae bacterium]